MKTIALVGGIGSGKSTIAHMFAELGAGIINLDDVGHFVLTTPGVKYDIARTFGANVFDERGEVVRSRLAACVRRYLRIYSVGVRPMYSWNSR